MTCKLSTNESASVSEAEMVSPAFETYLPVCNDPTLNVSWADSEQNSFLMSGFMSNQIAGLSLEPTTGFCAWCSTTQSVD